MNTKNSLTMRVNQMTMTIKEKTYKLDFDMQAFSFAEQVYMTCFGRDMNVAEIIAELYDMKMTAVMAFAYGAMRSAGEKITWEQFSKYIFTYDNFDDVFEVVSSAIEALFDTGEEAPPVPEGEDVKKN